MKGSTLLDFHWFLPTYGDSRAIVGGGHGQSAGAARNDRPATLKYLTSIATAAEDLGFDGVLTPTGGWCEDAWLTTAMLVQSTERIKFLVAFRPGLMSPTLAAQMAGTFQWQSGGRLLLNVVTGGESHEQRAYGDHLDKDARYERCSEFLEVVRRLWHDEIPVNLTGAHYQIEGATIPRRPDPVPALYFGGSSPAAGPVAADHCDVYLTWGEPTQAVAEKINWIRGLVLERDRQMRYGIRLHVIARETAEEAWAVADRLLAGIPDETIERVQANLRRSESEGQRRMLELHGGGSRDLLVAPNLWAGVGLARGGAGTALVGSYVEVADRIEEYADLGLSEFVLSGYPHLEEAYWFGEGVLPILASRGLWTHPDHRPPDATADQRDAVTGVPFAVAS